MYIIREIDAGLANRLVKRYHYSGKVVSNSILHLGVFTTDGFLDQLVGCLQYGYPINKNSTPIKISDDVEMMELNRMVMIDSEPRNSESAAIGACNAWLRKYKKNIKWLLSFSDGKEGNVGYIYQATNWDYIGYILSDSFYDLDGTIMHNISVWHKYKENHHDRDSKTTNKILCDNYKNVSKILSKQHIYIFRLNKYVKLKFEKQPYPKKDKELCILARHVIKRDGIVLESKEVVTYTDEKLTAVF